MCVCVCAWCWVCLRITASTCKYAPKSAVSLQSLFHSHPLTFCFRFDPHAMHRSSGIHQPSAHDQSLKFELTKLSNGFASQIAFDHLRKYFRCKIVLFLEALKRFHVLYMYCRWVKCRRMTYDCSTERAAVFQGLILLHRVNTLANSLTPQPTGNNILDKLHYKQHPHVHDVDMVDLGRTHYRQIQAGSKKRQQHHYSVEKLMIF